MADSAVANRRTRIAFPNAKVNLGLQVRKRRKDGYHDIESLFVPIDWTDTLELEVLPKGEHSALHMHGLAIPGPAANNLILKAHALTVPRAKYATRAFSPDQSHTHGSRVGRRKF